jgi:polysaccharide biosynthesis protein PslG
MDKRVLMGTLSVLAIIVVAGVVLALGSCNGDDEDVAQDTTPSEDVADTDDDDATPDVDTDDQTDADTDEPVDTNGTDDSDETDDPSAPDTGEGDNGEEEREGTHLPTGEPQRAQSGDVAYGFNIAWRADEGWQEYNAQTRDVVDSAGFNWIRFQIHWSEIERQPEQWDPLPLDRMVEAYDGSEIRILISIVGAPDWARDPSGESFLADYENFVRVMAFLADRYQGRVHAWEIWNEQNMAHEMHGTVRVADYAYLLEAGYRGVKAADPDALVVFGGLTPTGINDPAVAVDDVTYLESFYLYGDGYYAQFFDVMGMHLNATNNPPDTMWPDNPGPGEWTEDGSFYFLRGLELRAVMNRYGDDRPAWVTEFGWTTANQAPGYEYGADVSEEDQANYLLGAFNVAEEQMPWITGFFVWNLNFSTLVSPEDEKYPWSVLNEDWSPRPAYTALQEMAKR